MLFLPFLDRAWALPRLPRARSHVIAWAVLLVVIAIPAIETPGYFALVLTNLFLVALSEEWFFRAYFMTRIGSMTYANVAASLLFSLIHVLTRDPITGLLVFVPSLIYGWLYQHTRDLPLVVLVHALSNIFYSIFLAQRLSAWMVTRL